MESKHETVDSLRNELMAARAERDRAQMLCRLVEGHYGQLVHQLTQSDTTSYVSDAVSARTANTANVCQGFHQLPWIGSEILVPEDYDPRQSRVEERGWKNFDIPEGTQVLILSDSLFRSVNPNFMQDLKVELCTFSGLRSHELLEIMYDKVYQHFMGHKYLYSIVICVGTNDYYKPETTLVMSDVRKLITIAKRLAELVIICTVPDSLWKKDLYFSYEQLQLPRSLLNREIVNMSGDSVKVLDLNDMFVNHHGWRGEEGPGWYHRDSLHPNCRGTKAIEVCLAQLLRGQIVTCPSNENLSVSSQETEWRRDLHRRNYERFGL